jgi:hypothetical protein
VAKANERTREIFMAESPFVQVLALFASLEARLNASAATWEQTRHIVRFVGAR